VFSFVGVPLKVPVAELNEIPGGTLVAEKVLVPKPLEVKIRYAECPSRPMRTLPAGCGCDETACEYSRTRDAFELRCNVKPTETVVPGLGVKPNPQAPACVACPADPWLLLAVVTSGANGLIIDNHVRRVVPNTPALRGL